MSLEVSIKKHFKNFHLDVDIQAGTETLGFLGASGCGKSLTMRCIAGIETPDEGRIVVNGKVYFDSRKNINLKPQERKTAMLFQNFMLFPNMTVAQNIAAGIDRSIAKAERTSLIQHEMKRFGLEGFESRYPAQLSGGQQQRVALARMLAAKPEILMLDEPFSALDSHLKGLLEQNLVDLFSSFDGTILYVSHDIDEALRLCNRIAVVEDGRILEIDAPHELVNAPQSEAALKLSGCKNAIPAEKVGDYEVWIPKWGVHVQTKERVPDDVKYLGVRAFYVEQVSTLGTNCYRVRVDRTSDSRFDRSVLLGFLDRDETSSHTRVREEGEMSYFHEHLFWRIDTLATQKYPLPKVGDELIVHIPQDKIYLVSK